MSSLAGSVNVRSKAGSPSNDLIQILKSVIKLKKHQYQPKPHPSRQRFHNLGQTAYSLQDNSSRRTSRKSEAVEKGEAQDTAATGLKGRHHAAKLCSAQSSSTTLRDSNLTHFFFNSSRQSTKVHHNQHTPPTTTLRTLLSHGVPDCPSSATETILALAFTPLHTVVGIPAENSRSGIHINRSPPCSITNPSNEGAFSIADNTSGPMTSESSTSTPAQHKPLVVGRTKPQPETSTPSATMDSSSAEAKVPADVKAQLNHEIAENVKSNTTEAAPADPSAAGTKKKEKAPKQPKPPKAASAAAPVSPALIDLRVGHILRAIAHPNADSLFVSTIAMGDPEGTEHTQVDEQTGKVVRTVCSGLNGLVPLEEMQNRKVVVVANLKPVNMRSIKSAAMVLAASPPAEEGADPHAADRVVELVNPPEGAEAGDPVFFEGWSYGEGKGPEKVLNPKKKQWEAIQPGFFTSEDLVVGFDAAKTEIEGSEKGNLIVEGKGKCTVKSLKGAVVR
ncbi:hypothetical protein PV11_02850 [Exophiala sideris]|uniref:tRNA-binding domain-containing protein n=1 Tax=Exophiala sideris TaxID=1016849 RepID=A0A0D1WEP2_9EURO|nr:hypothetical protein PV11_02850 [Exophiala sideris]